MKFYYSPGACSLAPHIVLKEIGEPYDLKLVSSMDGSTRSDEHLSINPKGRVPVLSVDGEVITEAASIMMFLALQNPSCGLLSNTPIGVARTIEWTNWLSGIHASIIAQNWRTERFSDDVAAHGGIQSKGMENLRDTYHQIDTKLKAGEWVVNNIYSIVDPYLLVFFRWGNRLGLDHEDYENWTDHAERMELRTAVKSALETEEISIWQ